LFFRKFSSGFDGCPVYKQTIKAGAKFPVKQ